ncbi:hypothetical protein O3G_MSEX001104 [Manduca sexta]|nr:hypothetical protein O3G_MSEX001104 [Manduca sexta]
MSYRNLRSNFVPHMCERTKCTKTNNEQSLPYNAEVLLERCKRSHYFYFQSNWAVCRARERNLTPYIQLAATTIVPSETTTPTADQELHKKFTKYDICSKFFDTTSPATELNIKSFPQQELITKVIYNSICV